MKTKTQKQDEVIDKWTTSGKRGIFQAVPRFGKTRVGVRIIKESLLADPTYNVVVLVPSDIIRQQWIEEIKKEKNVNYLHKVVDNVITPKTLINKYKNATLEIPDLLVIDEIHRYFTEFSVEIRDLLGQINFIKFLGLTGVDVNTVLPKNVIHYFGGIIDIITEQEALENEWISPFIEYNIPLDLSNIDKERYTAFSKPMRETLDMYKGMANRLNNIIGNEFFKNDLQVIFSCYAGTKYKKGYLKGHKIRELVAAAMGWTRELNPNYPHSAKIILFWNPDNIYERCKEFKVFLHKRNEIILHNRVKIEAVLKILELNPVPTIIFNDSTTMVDEITEAIRSDVIAYHSNIKSRPVWDKHTEDYIKIASGVNAGKPKMFGKILLKKMAIEGMKYGRYKYLITAKSLDEGLDIPKVEQIITTSGSTNPITHLQRTSRGKTIDFNHKNKITKIFNLYFKDFYNDKAELIRSRDQQKLQMRQNTLLSPPITLNSLSQLSSLFE